MAKITIYPLDIKQLLVFKNITNELVHNYLIANEITIETQVGNEVQRMVIAIDTCNKFNIVNIDAKALHGSLVETTLEYIEYELETSEVDWSKLSFQVVDPLNEIDLSEIEYDGKKYYWLH